MDVNLKYKLLIMDEGLGTYGPRMYCPSDKMVGQ
jgi:hypothetical protein